MSTDAVPLYEVKLDDGNAAEYQSESGRPEVRRRTHTWTPLMQAVRFARVQEVGSLLASGSCDVDAQQSEGISALMIAAQYGYTEILESLIRAGANVRLTDDRGWNAVFFAASNGHLEVCKLLLDCGCDKKVVDAAGHHAASVASMNGHTVVTQLLMVETLASAGSMQSTVSTVAFELQINSLLRRLEIAEQATQKLHQRHRRSSCCLALSVIALMILFSVAVFVAYIQKDASTTMANGAQSLRVTSTTTDSFGSTVVSLSDGSTIVIPRGPTGLQGEAGVKGDTGPKGEAGAKGDAAVPLTVLSSSTDMLGNAVISFSDGSNITVPKGDNGKSVWISKISYLPSGETLLQFSDGNSTRIPSLGSGVSYGPLWNQTAMLLSGRLLPYQRLYRIPARISSEGRCHAGVDVCKIIQSLPKLTCLFSNCYGTGPVAWLKINATTARPTPQSPARTETFSILWTSTLSSSPIDYAAVPSDLPLAFAIGSNSIAYSGDAFFIDSQHRLHVTYSIPEFSLSPSCRDRIIDGSGRAGSSLSVVGSLRSGLYTITFHDSMFSVLVQVSCTVDRRSFAALYKGYVDSGYDYKTYQKLQQDACALPGIICGSTRTVLTGVRTDPMVNTILHASGYPVTVFRSGDDTGAGQLHLHFCVSDTCDVGGKVVPIVSTDGQDPLHPSIALGVDGNLVIAYHRGSGGGLYVISCIDTFCDSQRTPIELVSGTGNGTVPSLVIGADGLPALSYANAATDSIGFLHCLTITCSMWDAPVDVYKGFKDTTSTQVSIPESRHGSYISSMPHIFFANATAIVEVQCITLNCREIDFPQKTWMFADVDSQHVWPPSL
jgi:hypothetical protein